MELIQYILVTMPPWLLLVYTMVLYLALSIAFNMKTH